MFKILYKELNDLKTALINGGYNSYLAKVINYIKTRNLIQNFRNFDLRQFDNVILHVILNNRASKDMKELALNSNNIGMQDGFYDSLKLQINTLFENVPSATVVSYNNYF